MAEVLGDPEAREKQRSRESLTSDTVKYESGPDGGEEVSMSVEWNGVSAAHTAQPHSHRLAIWGNQMRLHHVKDHLCVLEKSQTVVVML